MKNVGRWLIIFGALLMVLGCLAIVSVCANQGKATKSNSSANDGQRVTVTSTPILTTVPN